MKGHAQVSNVAHGSLVSPFKSGQFDFVNVVDQYNIMFGTTIVSQISNNIQYRVLSKTQKKYQSYTMDYTMTQVSHFTIHSSNTFHCNTYLVDSLFCTTYSVLLQNPSPHSVHSLSESDEETTDVNYYICMVHHGKAVISYLLQNCRPCDLLNMLFIEHIL